MPHGRTYLSAIVASVLVSVTPVRSNETIAEVPFELHQRHLVVTKGSIGRLNGLSLLIDTGTIPSMVDARIARKLHLNAEPSMLIAFGQQIPIQSAALEGFRIGSLHSGPVPAGIGDLSYLEGVQIDAIVGLDVLARTSFSIDYQNARPRVFASRSRELSRASGAGVAVSDGADDDRRTAGATVGRHREQRSGAVQGTDARRPLPCALERRQDRAVRVRRRALEAARAAPGRPRRAYLGQAAGLVARSAAPGLSSEHRRRAWCAVARLPARAVRLRAQGELGWSQ